MNKLDKEVKIGNNTIIFEKTKPSEFLFLGYTLENLIQITMEPLVATCELHKDGELIAYLYFYNIAKEIAIDELFDIPIDFAYAEKYKKPKKNIPIVSKFLVIATTHFICASILLLGVIFPSIFRESFFGQFLVIGLLLTPTIVSCILLDNRGEYNQKASMSSLVLIGISAIFNFIFSISYVIVIEKFSVLI